MSLTRILEPEVMDTFAEASEYDAMDHQQVNEAFVQDLRAFAGSVTGEVLDLGAGTARIPITLCRAEEHCRVVATDLSVHMLQIAQVNIEIAGLADRILLHRQDAKALSYADGRFGWVISNSLIHHAPEPERVLAAAVRVAEPAVGGLFFRDLLRPETNSQVDDLVSTYADGESATARQLFADSLRAALSLREIRAYVADFGFDPSTVQQTTDRHWTWRVRCGDRQLRKMV